MKKLFFLALFATATVQTHAAIVQFYDLRGTAGFGLLPGNEPGSITGGTGGEIGLGIFLDDAGDVNPATNLLTLNVGWGSSQGFTDLSSATNGSHIHGPTAANNGSGFTQIAGVLFSLTRSSNLATGGTITTAPISLTATQVTELNNGRYYINIHTSTNSGGEIRGFIVPIPEPASAGLAALGALTLLATRRNRRA